MGHGHNHGAPVAASKSSQHKKSLAIVLALTTSYLVAEVVGGILTQSLALLADAGHMLTDAGGLALALLAIRLAERPATPERTFGYHRAEILAALANAVVLIGVSLYILYEAYERFKSPPQVASVPMLFVAVVGMVINVVGLLILRSSSKESLNLKGAYFEVLSDLLTSFGVLIAGVIMWLTGWYYADPIISAGIGLFIFPRTWALLKESVGILLEGTPAHINLAVLRKSIETIPGVVSAHDLHVWTITSGIHAMSVHVAVGDLSLHEEILERVHERMSKEFGIDHSTVQVERENFKEKEVHL